MVRSLTKSIWINIMGTQAHRPPLSGLNFTELESSVMSRIYNFPASVSPVSEVEPEVVATPKTLPNIRVRKMRL